MGSPCRLLESRYHRKSEDGGASQPLFRPSPLSCQRGCAANQAGETLDTPGNSCYMSTWSSVCVQVIDLSRDVHPCPLVVAGC